jgi:hypothetical protein
VASRRVGPRRWPRLAIVATAALALAACAGDTSAAEGETRVLAYDNHSESPARVSVRGVEIEVDAEVKGALGYLELRQGPGRRIQTAVQVQNAPQGFEVEHADFEGVRVWLAGRRIAVEGGELAIGERRYGAVGGGDAVRIAPDGVWVGGERRGPLPEVR